MIVIMKNLILNLLEKLVEYIAYQYINLNYNNIENGNLTKNIV